VKEEPRWVLWVAVLVALGIFSIAVQEFREDNPGEGVTWALLGLIAGGPGAWALWRRGRTS
jgi:membrane protein DedA with SNARE-associated domain